MDEHNQSIAADYILTRNKNEQMNLNIACRNGGEDICKLPSKAAKHTFMCKPDYRTLVGFAHAFWAHRMTIDASTKPSGPGSLTFLDHLTNSISKSFPTYGLILGQDCC